MDDMPLKNIIAQAISNIISVTGNEFASLEEIYNEVSKIRGEEINEAVKAQIRARLQECCSECTAFLGKEDFFETKEIGSGYWKNRITGETELTPFVIEIIKEYPGIDITTLKKELYNLITLTPGDMAISYTRPGEKKIDQIMRNFVSHKDSHKDILFDKVDDSYKMYYIGDDDELQDVDLYRDVEQSKTTINIIDDEEEIPEENVEDIKLEFITEDFSPKSKSKTSKKVFIRKNDIDSWIKREQSRVKNGNLAEALVFGAEKMKLEELQRPDLANKVRWVSRDDGDGFGYDIKSFEIDDNGKEKEIHIEVKSTSNINDDFKMSSNELNYARENKDKFRLYRVAKVKSKAPICKVVEVDIDDIFDFKPSEYNVTLKSDN